MLFTTIEAPAEFPLVGKGCLLQARICRPKKEAKGEANAKEISDVSVRKVSLLRIFSSHIIYIRDKNNLHKITYNEVGSTKYNWSARCQYNVTGWVSMWAYDMLSQ